MKNKNIAQIMLISLLLANLNANTNLDSQDIDSMLDSHSKSLLFASFVKKLDSPKIITISDIDNSTQEPIDTQLLIANFKQLISTKIPNLAFTKAIAGSGGKTDKMIKDARKLRDDDEFSQYTTQEKGELIAPDYSLSGKISKKAKPKGKKTLLEYQFLLSMVDLRTGIEIWSNTAKISKILTQKDMPTQKDYTKKDISDELTMIGPLLDTCITYGNKAICQDIIKKGLPSVKQCHKTAKGSVICGVIGGIYKYAGEYEKAIPYFKRAIFFGVEGMEAIYGQLGHTYEELQDFANARKNYEIACNKRDKMACYALAAIYSEGKGVAKDYYKAARFYKQACDMKNADACNYLGVLYANGQGVAKNYEEANALFKKACDFNDKFGRFGCANLGYAYLYGIGVNKSHFIGMQYMRKACELGNQEACDFYNKNK